MERVRRTTPRWAPRLVIGLVVSFAIHATPLIVACRLGHARPLDIEMQVHTVEIGLEAPRPGATNAPPRPLASQPVSVPMPAHPPEPTTAVVHPAPRPTPATHEPAPLPLPGVDTTLREPPLTAVRTHPPHLLEPGDLRTVPPPPTVASASPAPFALPTMASAASDLAPMVPRGALLTILLHADHLRADPNAGAVRRLLAGIRDWQDILGGTDLDPLNDLDELLLAAANPMGRDWFVLARGANGNEAPLRRAVEAMSGNGTSAASEAPSPVHPPTLDGSADLAGVHDAAVRSIWHDAANGAQMATFEQSAVRRSYVMMGGGVAAIARPGQVPALLAAMAQGGPSTLTSASDPQLAVLMEGEGLRNLVSFGTWRGPFPIPSRSSLALYEVRDGPGAPTGGARLESAWQYDTPAEAEHAREMFEYARGRWHVMIAEQLGPTGGINRLFAGAAASLMGIDIGAVESSMDALQFRTDGARLVIHAELTPTQTAAVLRAAAIGSP